MARSRHEIGDFCIKGHKIEGDNVYWRKQDGVMYIRCAICMKAKSARHQEKRKIVLKEKTRAERYDKILSGDLDGTSAKYTGLNYLKLNKRAQNAWEPLQKAFDEDSIRQGLLQAMGTAWDIELERFRSAGMGEPARLHAI